MGFDLKLQNLNLQNLRTTRTRGENQQFPPTPTGDRRRNFYSLPNILNFPARECKALAKVRLGCRGKRGNLWHFLTKKSI
ncbi:MAG: hypothetical protein D6680_05810 [Cyanobacteria bacterium J007]|nr:MAG: hypothetical protein D6680_05810 [Cyanobacteria bacterium J007]